LIHFRIVAPDFFSYQVDHMCEVCHVKEFRIQSFQVASRLEHVVGEKENELLIDLGLRMVGPKNI
jgi:hypothetical protein